MADTEKLETNAELLAEKAENLPFCRGIKLFHIRKSVNELLAHIGKCGFFEEYTLHDASHIDEMLRITEWLIPAETQKAMTSAEWLMLTLAIYFHDLGMVITKSEYQSRLDNRLFVEYKNNALSDKSTPEYIEYAKKDGDDKFLYQEFVREHHAERIHNWLTGKNGIELGGDNAVLSEIHDMLSHLDTMFLNDLGLICESHHLDDIDDFSKYKVNVCYGNGENETVNLDYIAIIYRVADLLHITRNRTPSITRKLINVSNPVSVIEWEKQQAVRAVKPQAKRNEEKSIDNSLEKDTIEVTAYFDGPDTAEAFFGLSAYLQYTRRELAKCKEIVQNAQKSEGATSYLFPWCDIDESQIIANGFEKKKLSFTIAQENILQLLVGHTLYNDSSVVTRELVQNGIDAVKLQKVIETRRSERKPTDGRVLVVWDETKRELSFTDNGTGMTILDVENYLLRVGASKYRDDTFKKNFPDFNPISHFGIGLLTCFMVANDIDILTKAEGQSDASLINLRRVNGSYLLRKINHAELPPEIQKHGTTVTLHIRTDVDLSNPERDLKKWVVAPEVPVFLSTNGAEQQIGFHSLRDALATYLNEVGMTVDGKTYNVLEDTVGSVTIAYAVQYAKYFKDWSLMHVRSVGEAKGKPLPVGTCLEGIRVEFTTPGYRDQSILAIANVRNSSYQTNVARSEIEFGSNRQLLSDIYSVYAHYINSQMDMLKKDRYSSSWAMSEGRYLMYPLLQQPRRAEIVDRDILLQQLASLKCLILESGNKREEISAAQAEKLDEINVFECRMTESAERLLTELSSSATLQDIMSAVDPQNNSISNLNNLLCNYYSGNALHKYALRNKSVSSIKVNRQQRSICLTYRDDNNNWEEFHVERGESLFIPRKSFQIEGLEDEIGVRSNCGVFLRSDSELCSYLLRTADIIRSSNPKHSVGMLNEFMSHVLNATERKFKDLESFRRYLGRSTVSEMENRWMSTILQVIDTVEFSKTVLAKNYALFSISNWTRSTRYWHQSGF